LTSTNLLGLSRTMFGIHPDLRRHTLVAFVASAALGAAGAATLAGFAADAPGFRAIPVWAAIGFCAVAFGVAYLGTVATPRGYREWSRIVSAGQPIAGTAIFSRESSSDSTSLSARVEPVRGFGSPGEVALLWPRWDITPLLGSPFAVSLYIHPAKLTVVAIKTAQGLVWSIPVRGRRGIPK
jgi:hypothetical protein